MAIDGVRFGSIYILGSKHNKKTGTTSLWFKLTGKEHLALSPFSTKKDSFTLHLEKTGHVTGEYYWPGAGDLAPLSAEAIAPLIQETHAGNDVWLGKVPSAYNHFEKALAQFMRKIRHVTVS